MGHSDDGCVLALTLCNYEYNITSNPTLTFRISYMYSIRGAMLVPS